MSARTGLAPSDRAAPAAPEPRAPLPASRLLLTALGLLALTALLGALLGTHHLGLADFARALTGADPRLHTLLVALRLPRVAGALLLGALLGLSGALLQRSTRNLLADPGLLGLHSGAQLAVLLLMLGASALTAQRWRAPAAFLGAALAAALVWLLARKQGRVAPRRLLLIGIAVGAGLHAIALLLTFSAPIDILSRALIWNAGNLASLRWGDDALMALALAALLPLALLLARPLDALGLGEEAASSLGVRVDRARFAAAGLAALAAGLCVAMAGGLAFVGLLAPNLALRLTGPRTARLIALATVAGAIVVGLADTLARTALTHAELPTGTLVAAAGAPYFLWLLLRG